MIFSYFSIVSIFRDFAKFLYLFFLKIYKIPRHNIMCMHLHLIWLAKKNLITELWHIIKECQIYFYEFTYITAFFIYFLFLFCFFFRLILIIVSLFLLAIISTINIKILNEYINSFFENP